jgi:phospholipase D1/2
VAGAFFVGGSSYYESLAKALNSAKHRVFIADWYLSIRLFLLRGETLHESQRLDQILRMLSRRGVKIYILLYHEFQAALSLKTDWTLRELTSLSSSPLYSSIHIVRHPYTHPSMPLLWSHHQKFVVIDDVIAYIGGIDLCFNRYEDDRYLVTDPNSDTFPGRDYSNVAYDQENNGEAHEEVLDRSLVPRSPWQDVQMCVDGMAAWDISRNFIARYII